MNFSEQQKAARGDLAARARLEQDERRWNAWRCTLEYNRELRAAGNAAVSAAPPASAGSATAPHKAASASKADTDADSGQAEDDENLSPSRVTAKALYEWASARIQGADRMTRTELYNAIIQRLEAEAVKARGLEGERLAELRKSLPPSAEAFAKYLRDAGIKVYNRKGDRQPGRSIRRRDEV